MCEREVYFPEGPGVDGFKSNTREVTYTYTSNERRVDIHDLEVRMSAVAAKRRNHGRLIHGNRSSPRGAPGFQVQYGRGGRVQSSS